MKRDPGQPRHIKSGAERGTLRVRTPYAGAGGLCGCWHSGKSVAAAARASGSLQAGGLQVGSPCYSPASILQTGGWCPRMKIMEERRPCQVLSLSDCRGGAPSHADRGGAVVRNVEGNNGVKRGRLRPCWAVPQPQVGCALLQRCWRPQCLFLTPNVRTAWRCAAVPRTPLRDLLPKDEGRPARRANAGCQSNDDAATAPCWAGPCRPWAGSGGARQQEGGRAALVVHVLHPPAYGLRSSAVACLLISTDAQRVRQGRSPS